METPEQIRDRLLARFPGASVTPVPNPAPGGVASLALGADRAREMAAFLRDDPALKLDYCSNATGVDWFTPPKPVAAPPVPTKPLAPPTGSASGGEGGPFAPKPSAAAPPGPAGAGGFLEAVYHLYSMSLRHGPLVIRMRTASRAGQPVLPSLTPVWRSCEFQEREIFDLFGIVFEGHPDLRRILMWDAFKDHPMRKDYVEPDDYEWEPTAHDEVLAKAKTHMPAPQGGAAP